MTCTGHAKQQDMEESKRIQGYYLVLFSMEWMPAKYHEDIEDPECSYWTLCGTETHFYDDDFAAIGSKIELPS